MMQKLKFEEVSPGSSFNPLLISDDTPFTQAYFYGQWQQALGRKIRRFIIKNSAGEVVCFAQFISYPLIHGKNCLYAPYGPILKGYSKEVLSLLKEKLISLAIEENWIFARLDFTPPPRTGDIEKIKKLFRKASKYTYRSPYFQPRTDWVIDLQKTEETLLMEMNSKTRYGIKFAQKKDVTVEIRNHDLMRYFDDFYSLMEESSRRNSFSLHPKEYYKMIFENSEKLKNTFLVIARHNGKIVVVDYILVFGKTANYLFSGSSDEGRRFSSSYLTQWTAIRNAKNLGCSSYNFGGISTDELTIKEWKGLSSFKKRFNGHALVHADFYDIVFMPFWYKLYIVRKIVQSFSR